MSDLAIDGSGEPDDDLCGSGYYRKFVADEIPYVAWASFGPDVSEADRAIALDALTLAGGGFLGGGWSWPSPAYVLAGTDGGRLELTPSRNDGGNVDLALTSVGGRGGSFGTGDFTVPDVPVEDCSMGSRCRARSSCRRQRTFRGSARSPRAPPAWSCDPPTAVNLPVPGTLVPLPPSLMNFAFDLFFLDAGALNGKIVATGLETPTPSVTPADPTITLSPSPDVGPPR